MAEVVDANQAEVAPAEGEQPAPQSFWSMTKGLLVRGLVIYLITSFFSKKNAPVPTTEVTEGGVSKQMLSVPAMNLYEDATSMDFYAYLSSRELLGDKFPSRLLWQKSGLVYGDWTSGPEENGVYSHSLSLETTEGFRNNGSLWLHAFLVKRGNSPDPRSKRHDALYTAHTSHRLNKYMKLKYRKTANLITGHTDKSEEEILKAETVKEEILSHWHPNLTINVVHDFTQWVPGSVPAPLDTYVKFTPTHDRYLPIIFANNYWCLQKEYQPINSTVTVVNLTLSYQPISMLKWQMYASQLNKNKMMGGGFMESLTAGEEDDDQDAMKEALLETSPAFLAFTAIATLLHTVFEMLAFKNDIQFWNNRKSLEGLSVRSVFFNVFQALLVLLYVCDNETNFVIKMSCFAELCIQLWKISKAKDISINWDKRILGVPTLLFADKESYTASETDKFDQMAFKYVGWCLFPLLGGYSVYSLIYYEHKGWYSFTLSMLYSFLLMFGFIKMTPQLFINYKMKSVAHLPWRMLTYKAINTFIDDLFAFVIKMPTLYRIGCLRDDVIFVIFVYQRYIYRIDPSRVNEFGFSKEDLENKPQEGSPEAIEQKPGTAEAIEQGTGTAEAIEQKPDAGVAEEAVEKSVEEKKED